MYKFSVLKIILFTFILGSIGAFVVFFLTSLLLLMRKGGDMNSPYSVESSYFQYVSHDSSTDEITMGMVSLPADALEREEKGFIEYGSEDVQVLISDFGSTEYVCTGTCHCSDDGTVRRGVGSAIPRTLTYLVASASAFLAFSYAKEYFEESCSEAAVEMGCSDKDYIVTSVDDCTSPMANVDSEGKDWDHKSYMCRGNCVPNVYGDTEKPEYDLPEDMHEAAVDFDCELLEYEMQINLETPDREMAEKEFMKKHLKYFCLDNSLKEVEDYKCLDDGPEQCDIVRPPASKENMKICVTDTDVDTSRDTKSRESGEVEEGKCTMFKTERKTLHMCHGYMDQVYAFKGRYHNPTVKCRPMSYEKKE